MTSQGGEPMRRSLMALLIAGAVAVSTTKPAEARWGGWGWGLGAFAIGALIGAALWRPAYSYRYPAYGYGYGYPAYGYGYGYPAYSYGYGYPSYGYGGYYPPYFGGYYSAFSSSPGAPPRSVPCVPSRPSWCGIIAAMPLTSSATPPGPITPSTP